VIAKIKFQPKNKNYMSIIRYNPADYVPATFSNLVNRFFNESLARTGGSLSAGQAGSFVPKVDIIENDHAFKIHFAVPGLNKDDFNIEIKDNFLTVSGERKFTNEKKDKNFHSIETNYGSFSRSFSLPEDVSTDKVQAKYNNGILELTLPKDEKKALKQTIKVS
jgi:HSP20 family protein